MLLEEQGKHSGTEVHKGLHRVSTSHCESASETTDDLQETAESTSNVSIN